jgi:hypothetical protein
LSTATISASLASRRTSFSTRVISASTPRRVIVRSLSPAFIAALRSSWNFCFTRFLQLAARRLFNCIYVDCVSAAP